MNRINVNGQNGVATSAVVNVKMYYITETSVKKVVNAFESVEERREIIEIISEAVAYGKKDFYLYYKIGDFVGCFSLDKDYKGNYVLCYGDRQVNLWFSRLSGAKNFNTLESEIYNAIREMVFKMSELVVEQEQEQENEDIDYLVTIFNEKMVEDITKDFESTLQSIAEYGDPSGDLEHVCGGFNYERDYEHEWVEFYNENGNGGINHAYEIFRNAPSFTYVDFFNEDDACDLVYELADEYGVGVDDNCCENCLVWVKNPYYVAEVEDAPILDDDVDRVVNTIKTYLANYTPSYLDQFGDCVITIDWDNFSEEDMQMLIEDDIFEGLVIDSLVGENISDMLVYDNGVYVTVDYDKMFNKVA